MRNTCVWRVHRIGLALAILAAMPSAALLGITLGFVSALHCIAMCGPLVAFVAIAPSGETEPGRVVRYQLGRVIGYAGLGAAAGAFGGALTQLVPAAGGTILSITLGIALVVVAAQLWPRAQRSEPLTALGRSPRAPSMRERATRGLASMFGRVRRAPMLFGALSALLPCGVIASGVLLAASTGSAALGAVAMGSLAITSGLVVGISGVGLGRVRIASSPVLARAMAITLVLGALVTVSRPLFVTPEGGCCEAHP